jgi:hypothetical protein
VQRFGDDQGGGGAGSHGGQAALPVGPAAGVRLPGLVGEDDLARGRMLDIASEGQVGLVSGRVPDLERAGDLGDVQHGHRDGEGQRDRVAQVDQGVQRGQAPFLAEAAQQRLRGAAVLGGLEPHPGKGPPPGLDLGQLALGSPGEAGRGRGVEPVGLDLSGGGDAVQVQDAGY